MTGRDKDLLLRFIVRKWSIVILFSVFFLPGKIFAQKEEDLNEDEITVSLEVKGIGNADLPAIIRDKDILLPVNSIFDFLKIKNTPSSGFDSLSGFYVNQRDRYVIDKIHNRIIFKDTVTELKPGDLLKEENNLYLNLKYFKSVFRLNGEFNFRRLAVTLVSDIELPGMIEAKQELMRRNVNRLRGDVLADTTIKRTYPLFHMGTADWAFTSTQQSVGGDQTKLSLGLGAVVLAGEANASLNYFPGYQWDQRQQYYQWRYVNNDNSAVRQVTAGNIFAQSISSLYAPVIGVQVTNAPTTYRKSYGTYTISSTTDPGWIVELYVNNVLIDYKKADAAGFYSFDVPLIYGYSIIRLRFFGPYGEERTTQTYINIPFNFLPVHEFEYTASGGVVEDGVNSIFSRVGLNYGLSRFMTIGGGVEYLSSVTTGNNIPFINTSIKLAQNLLVSGEYDYGVKARGTLSYRMPSNIQLDLDYTNYDKGQTAIYFNYLQERKAVLSMPIHFGGVSIFSRLTVDQISVPNANYTNAEWTFTGTVRNVGVNYSNYASFVEETSPYFYGLASLSFKAPWKTMFTSQLQYDYKAEKPVFMKFTLEKHMLGSGFFNISYQEFFNNGGSVEQPSGNYKNILVGMRYDFSFSRVASSALVDNKKGYSIVESASGSLIYDHKSGYLNANNRANVGKSEIALEPFLDMNCNGVRDPGEPRVSGVKIQLNGGRIVYDEKDTIIRVLDLEAYINYYVTLSTNGLDNIAWQIKNKVLKIAVSPNDFNLVKIPVEVFGEVSGVVSRFEKEGGAMKGERQIIVNIFDSQSNLVARPISESDGFFNYIGLPPGNYTAQVDVAQLQKLHLKSNHPFLPIHISQSKEGDIVDGLEFALLPEAEDTSDISKAAVTKKANKAKADSAAKKAVIVKPKENFILDSVIVTGGRSVVFPRNLSERSLYDMAIKMTKLYEGNVVCIFNDDGDIEDMQVTNAAGEFMMYDYKPCRIALPDPKSGIVSQTIFLNEDLQLLTSINKRVINGKFVFLPNNKEVQANRVKVRITTGH